MDNRFYLIWKYMGHLLRSYGRKGHRIHSPFVFEFVTSVLKDPKTQPREFENIERVRSGLVSSRERLEVKDLGAGSLHAMGSTRTVGSIAKHAAKPSKFGRLFYRMVRYYGIASVLELGTSLGMTTRYLSAARPEQGVVTIEGSPAIASMAAASFVKEGYSDIRVLVGEFGEYLEKALVEMRGPKLVFFDGNHRYAPTMDYFTTALKHAAPADIFIFDDIHWSPEMQKAWKEIQNCEQVACTVDLFFIGIVFFRKEFKEKLDFSIRF